ncbi:hypothetical protein [Gracilibacillus dipsosauri]
MWTAIHGFQIKYGWGFFPLLQSQADACDFLFWKEQEWKAK